MACLALYAIFLIASFPLFVRSDDTGLQTFVLTAVNATVMRLDSVDATVPLSYVFTVFGNRSTANCTFTGLNPTKSDWIVSSRCPGVTNEGRFYVNRTAFDFEFEDSWQVTGPWTVYAVQRSRTVSGGSEDDPSYEPLPPTALERRWDFALGRFVIEEHHIIVDDTNKPSSSGTVPIGKKRRKKRNVLSDNQLELGVNVDQCLWDQFLSAYGPDTSAVRKALDDYVDAIVATANLMWNLDSIQPNLNIRIVKYQVWTTQPEDAPAAYQDDIENYLQSTCLLAKPNASGFDHSTVLSGCNLTQNGQMVGGLAYSDQVCTDGSCSVISGGVGAGLRAGYTLAHEIGHAINMKHDGDTRYAETSHCDPNCCMMTPYGASSTAAEWSVCSKMRYHEKLVGMMVDDSNCLESLDAVTPPKEMPGQEKPDEGQCMDQLGSCGRHYISDDSDCTKLYCTNTNGETATVFEIIRLDGSHCGPNKICEMGICVESPVTLPIVDGGWSGWNSNAEDICGGSNCSVCTVNDQVSARVEVRRCDNPYPLNGGAPCPGLNVRGIFCANCSNTGSLIDVDSHETNQCSAKYPGSIVTATTECTFVCSLDGVFQGRLWLPAGTLCSDNGRCINGQCLHTLCADLNVYVGAVSDCPTDTVVDCRYSPWSTWSDCSVTCDAGSQTRSRTITQVALNGGAPCDESSLGETQSCALDACPSEITTTTMTITQGTSTTTPTSLSSTSSSGSITAPNGCAYVMTWPKVWQDLTFSSESKIIGPKASCATSCNEWTAFTCRGFLSAGPGRECILFGAVTGQILLSNQSIYDMYEPICPGDSVDYTVCSFVMVSSHVNMTAAGPGKFGGYFKFQSSCAELCIRNYGILPCAAFIYQWDNGKCTLYPNKLTGQTDSSSASDLYEKQCEIRQSPSG